MPFTRITVGASSGTATPAARDQFWYDPDGERFLGRESWDVAGVQKQARTVYLANFEEVIPATGSAFNLVQRTDVSATVPHIRTRTTGGSVATRFEYVYRDHLGSFDVVTGSPPFNEQFGQEFFRVVFEGTHPSCRRMGTTSIAAGFDVLEHVETCRSKVAPVSSRPIRCSRPGHQRGH